MSLVAAGGGTGLGALAPVDAKGGGHDRAALPRAHHACATGVRAQVAAKPHLGQAGAADMAAAISGAASAASSGCPFSKLSAAITSPLPKPPDQQGAREAEYSAVVIPGPQPFSLESLIDVSQIFFHGLHAAMLQFSMKYGPICRYARCCPPLLTCCLLLPAIRRPSCLE